jgi:DNA-binding LacI/PurR family transcriptional regulator
MDCSMKFIKPVTSIDVAKLAGVSQSAVSRAFTSGAAVSDKTRSKIMVAAKALKYRPNAIARTLSTNRSRIIGMVLSQLDNLFYPTVVDKLSRALQQHGYHLMLFFAEGRDVDDALTQLLAYQLDGVVLASTTLSSRLAKECINANIPVVMFNRSADGAQASSVTSNNREGGRMLGEFLLENGHSKIAYIAGREDSSTNRDREAGLSAALGAANLSIYRRAVGNYERDAAAIATRALFTGKNLPDSVVVASDHMAFAVIDTLRFELGKAVPTDVSVVSFDNVAQAEWPAYELTTIAQSADAMVSATANLLIDQINASEIVSSDVVVGCKLIVRNSARLLPKLIHSNGRKK